MDLNKEIFIIFVLDFFGIVVQDFYLFFNFDLFGEWVFFVKVFSLFIDFLGFEDQIFLCEYSNIGFVMLLDVVFDLFDLIVFDFVLFGVCDIEKKFVVKLVDVIFNFFFQFFLQMIVIFMVWQ